MRWRDEVGRLPRHRVAHRCRRADPVAARHSSDPLLPRPGCTAGSRAAGPVGDRGELLVWDAERGRCSFSLLQRRLTAGRGLTNVVRQHPAHFVAFDVLRDGRGVELLDQPLTVPDSAAKSGPDQPRPPRRSRCGCNAECPTPGSSGSPDRRSPSAANTPVRRSPSTSPTLRSSLPATTALARCGARTHCRSGTSKPTGPQGMNAKRVADGFSAEDGRGRPG